MLQIGDIVHRASTGEQWVIIDRDLIKKMNCSEYLWRVRRRKEGQRLPECAVLSESEIELICRPLFYIDLGIHFRNWVVRVRKDQGTRVACEIVAFSKNHSSRPSILDEVVGCQRDIYKPALVEWNIGLLSSPT